MNQRGQWSPLSFATIEMIAINTIQKLADEKLAEGGNFIVDISVKPGNKIVILLDNDKGVSISDCVAMSRHVEAGLDREVEDYELNVMSPGLTEPFKIPRQYQKNIGKQVDVVTKENEKMSGIILTADDKGITLETKTKEKQEGKKGKQLITNTISLTYNQIKKTTVVISF